MVCFSPMNRQWLVIALGLLTACSSQTIAPALAHCNDAGCNPNTIVSGGNGGSGNAFDSGNGLGVTLNVSIVEFNQNATGSAAWSPSNVQELSGTFTANVPSSLGTILSVTSASPITIENALVSEQSWVSVTPASGSVYLPGMHNIPSVNAASVSVPLLQTRDLDFVQSLLSTQPLTLDLTKAQVIVKVVDSGGSGVPGVRALGLGAQVMAYASGSSWVDDSTNPNTATDVSGRLMAINLNASPQPGGFVTVTVTGLSPQGSTLTVTGLIPIQAGFVSYGTILYQ